MSEQKSMEQIALPVRVGPDLNIVDANGCSIAEFKTVHTVVAVEICYALNSQPDLRAQLDAAKAACAAVSERLRQYHSNDYLTLLAERDRLTAELARLNQEQEGPVDQFISKLFIELERHGVDTSCWDGDEPPHVIIAGRIADLVLSPKPNADIKRLTAELAEARGVLTELYGLVENGILVRDCSKDADPKWYLTAISLTQTLAKSRAAIDAARRGE
jgi:hypothetical protein